MLSTDILSRLRQATSSRHAMLDQAMPLADPAATLETYRDHLMLLRQWLAPIEHWQARFADGPQAQGLLPQLAHVALIDADLQHPSIPLIDTPAAAGSGAASLSWQQGDDAPYRWGVSYVIEGSRLGGEVLRRTLCIILAMSKDQANAGPASCVF